MIQEPVELDMNDNKWYFWHENWAFRSGPFGTKNEAYTALDRYCKEQLGEPDITKTHSFEEMEGLE